METPKRFIVKQKWRSVGELSESFRSIIDIIPFRHPDLSLRRVLHPKFQVSADGLKNDV